MRGVARDRSSRSRRIRPGRLLDAVRRTGVVLSGILLIFLLVAVVLLALAPRAPETPESVEDLEALERFLVSLVASKHPPGLSVAVVDGDAIIYRRGFGYADGPRAIPASQKTIYKWWSLTKILTAVAVFQLRERGVLGLDDPVQEHLPFFEVTLRGKEVPPPTIRQLLNHSSGLGNLRLEVLQWTHLGGARGRDSRELLREVWPRFRHLRFEPGRRGVYSNFGYMVLGALVEKISGTSYEDYVRDNILEPLAMKRTDFVATREMQDDLAAGSHPLVNLQTLFLPATPDWDRYIREMENGRLWLEPFYLDVSAYGGALGPVTDAARLLLAFIGEGSVDGRRILRPETVHMMLTEGQVRAGPSNVAPAFRRRAGMRHGLGWWVFPDANDPMYEHTGAGPGFATIFRLYSERPLGIAVFSNGTALDRTGIADLLAQVFGN